MKDELTMLIDKIEDDLLELPVVDMGTLKRWNARANRWNSCPKGTAVGGKGCYHSRM